MLTANTLSRAYIEDCERSPAKEEVDHIHANHFLPVSDHQLEEIQRERDNLSLCASELEKHNLGWLLRWKRLSPGGNPSTSDKPQAAPSAEAQIVPKQLDKAAVEIWAFPGRRRSRLHSCQSLPSCIKKGPVSLCNTWQFSRNRS